MVRKFPYLMKNNLHTQEAYNSKWDKLKETHT